MCVSPISLKVNNINGVRTILVPCGKCNECLKKLQNDWMLRMCEEFCNWSKACFVTLTYNEDSVPLSVNTDTGEYWKTVCKAHVQSAIKRYRTNVKRSSFFDCKPFKYFICSEYGPRTLRPHYHCLFFGLDKYDLTLFLNDWSSRYGFTNAQNVKYGQRSFVDTSRYVSKYCTKGVFENPFVKAGYVQKSFRLISKGIGKSYVDRMRDFHRGNLNFFGSEKLSDDNRHYNKLYLDFVCSNMRVRIDNSRFSYSMPKYYKDKIYVPKSKLSVACQNYVFEKSCDLRESRIKQIQSFYGLGSPGEAMRFMDMQDASLFRYRNYSAFKALANFYDKSKL